MINSGCIVINKAVTVVYCSQWAYTPYKLQHTKVNGIYVKASLSSIGFMLDMWWSKKRMVQPLRSFIRLEKHVVFGLFHEQKAFWEIRWINAEQTTSRPASQHRWSLTLRPCTYRRTSKLRDLCAECLLGESCSVSPMNHNCTEIE